jgi:hypothetical protein
MLAQHGSTVFTNQVRVTSIASLAPSFAAPAQDHQTFKETQMKDPTRIAGIARWHLLFGLAFAGLGMLLGIGMAMSGNHVEMPAHAHLMLLGFVVSAVYAVVYRLWLPATGVRLAIVQTALHEAGAVVMGLGLVLMFGGIVTEASAEPLLGVGSLSALAGVVVMIWQVARVGQDERPRAGAAAASGAA